MSATLFDSLLHGRLVSDEPVSKHFSDAAEIESMVAAERALARAQARLGLIPQKDGYLISDKLDGIDVPASELSGGAASAGVPVPALVAHLRKHLPPEAAHWLHWGATSQDIMDTGQALRLTAALDVLGGRLARVVEVLAGKALRWRDLPMAARTRSRLAVPISLGLRIARWRQPLAALVHELPDIRRKTAVVQLGGAAGSNEVLGDQGEAAMQAFAEELGLHAAPSWHVDRTGPLATASWCTRLTTALGKMAADLLLMTRSETQEVTIRAGGGSSTMPQKANPIAVETIVALARYSAALMGPMHGAALQAEERDGVAWTLERLVLPQIVISAGGALNLTETVVCSLEVNEKNLRQALLTGGGAIMAERASFILARAMPRSEANAIVAKAARKAASGNTDFITELARLAPDHDWPLLLDETDTGAAAATVDTLLAGQAER